MGVVVHVMGFLANDVLGVPAQNLHGRCIAEGSPALVVQSVNAFAGGIEDQLVHCPSG